VKLLRSLDEVEEDAGGALDREAQPSLFHRLSWFRLLETHCPQPGDLLVIRSREDGKRAWLFLKVQHGQASALANWYSFEAGIVASPPGPPCEFLVAGLIRGLREAGIAGLELTPLVAGEPLNSVLRGRGWLTRVTSVTARWRMDAAGQDSAGYWARRPSRLRNTAARKARAAALGIRIHTRFDATAWADYELVYRESWKPEEGCPAFLRALAEQEGAAGTLRLGLAYQGDRPVAAQFWVSEGGTATIHKLAHVEDAQALSPGTLLGQAMFRHALDVDRVSAIDFGLGDEPYKADWVDRRDVMHRLVAYDLRSPRGLGLAAAATARALVRRLRND
jgi:hypothetical protein